MYKYKIFCEYKYLKYDYSIILGKITVKSMPSCHLFIQISGVGEPSRLPFLFVKCITI